MYRLALIALLLLASCTQERLTLQTSPITYQELASYIVKTPDPEKKCPDVGQRLIATWSLPKECLCAETVELYIDIRFGSGEESTIIIPIEKSTGMYTYCLLNDEFCEKDGIVAFRGQVIANDEIIEEWNHQVWANTIAVERIGE